MSRNIHLYSHTLTVVIMMDSSSSVFTRRICVKKVHGGTYDAAEHGVMEMHRCTHANLEECDGTHQCYYNGAHSHSSIDVDAGLSTQHVQKVVVCQSVIYVVSIFK